MARGDGINRISVRNVNLRAKDIKNVQRHNEREKESYNNQDIVKDQTFRNIYFKHPAAGYEELFQQMKKDGVISTRGLKDDAKTYGELIFDVNSAYFYNHGGYSFAQTFYEAAYRAAVEIVGGEQYILSAVMHADERNRAMSEALHDEIFHYHLHVVYVPVVEKQILWTKRCKDPSLVGTVKETVMQVSSSKKWKSQAAHDENGNPLLTKSGKPVLRKSYSVLQDQVYEFMQKEGFRDVERGERGSSEEHLTVTQFKVEKEQERLAELTEKADTLEADMNDAKSELEQFQKKVENILPLTKKAEAMLAHYDMEYDEDLLPEPGKLEGAKHYRETVAMPLLRELRKLVKNSYRLFLDTKAEFAKFTTAAATKIKKLKKEIEKLKTKKSALEEDAGKYRILCKLLGKDKMEANVAKVQQLQEEMRQQNRKHHHYNMEL